MSERTPPRRSGPAPAAERRERAPRRGLKGHRREPRRRGRPCAGRRGHARRRTRGATSSSAQIDAEVARLAQAVADAKRHVREVSARLPPGPLETNAHPRRVPHDDRRPDAHRAGREEDPGGEEVRRVGRRPGVRGDRQAVLARRSRASGDAYIVERRHDIEFVCDRLLRELTGDTKHIVPRLDQPMVVIARDLSPADTAGMVREPVIAFVTEIGTRTSHTAIMARALEIPAVVGRRRRALDDPHGRHGDRRRPAGRGRRQPERDHHRGGRAVAERATSRSRAGF